MNSKAPHFSAGAAYTIATAPFVPKSTLWWTLPILLLIALPLMLASYQFLVRYSFIGAVLNGRRVRRGGQITPTAAEGSAAM